MARPKAPLIKPAEAVATALEVIDRDGLSGFNLRKLARELDVNPSSLYHHFHDKNEILHRVCILVLEESGLFKPLRLDAEWQVRVKKMIGQYRYALMRHPNVAPLMTPNGPLGHFRDSLGHHGVTELLDEGVPRQYVYPIIDSINSLAYGSGPLEPPLTDDDAQVGPAPAGPEGLDEVRRSAPRSPHALFEMQVDALLEGWTIVLNREKATLSNSGRKRKVPSSNTG